MKKTLIILILTLILFISCETTFTVKRLVAPEVNMSKYKGLAILPARNNSYLNFNSNDYLYFPNDIELDFDYEITRSSFPDITMSIGNYFADVLEQANYFNIVRPVDAKVLLDNRFALGFSEEELWMRKNVQALLIPVIEDINQKQALVIEPDFYMNPSTGLMENRDRYYVKQEVYIKVYYQIIDVRTKNIIASQRLTGRDSSKTEIVVYEDDEYGLLNPFGRRKFIRYQTPTLNEIVKNIFNSFESDIRKKLVPYYVDEQVVFAENSPKDPIVDSALSYVRSNDLHTALELFSQAYRTNNHLNAAYNMILIYDILNKQDEGISFAKEIFAKTQDPKFFSLMKKLEFQKNRREKALNSI